MIAAMTNATSTIRLDKRDLILTKGSEVMLRRGYHGTGVQEIVQAAGIPKGSFYHYFASKEDFAVHALEFLYAPRLQRYAQALSDQSQSPCQRILSFYGELLNHFRRQERPQYHCFIGSLSFEMAEPSQPIGLQVESILQRSVNILAQCLTEAREAGELNAATDCVELAEFIANAWEGTLMRMKAGANAAPLSVFLHQLERLLTPTY
jgi:TetR/AcrR family transcriptional repressor of nem operon